MKRYNFFNFPLRPATMAFVVLFTPSIMSLSPLPAEGQNYDESQVPSYQLPDPLVFANGDRVKSAAEWHKQRRDEILNLFQTHVYGRSPETLPAIKFTVTEQDAFALDGSALRKQVTIRFGQEESAPALRLLIYLPRKSQHPVPLFLALNFHGNQTIHEDPQIDISKNWTIGGAEEGIVDHRANETSRGTRASRWPITTILARGYGVATAHCGDLDPDFDDGFKNGIHPLFYAPGQTAPKPDQWRTIGAWSWGLSRALDYFKEDRKIDENRVIVLGHSRLGKTALWAGAQDERFAMVISNNSGCGGAALSRRRFGETVASINRNFPHWFCEKFKEFDDNEAELPIDQHMLIALIAPRPVYVASAVKDRWADPRGEFFAAVGADPVYRLLGTDGLPTDKMPPIDSPIHGAIGYHVRQGDHDLTEYDWLQYLDFADRHLNEGDRAGSD